MLVRPHLLDVYLEPTSPDALPATVEHVNPARPLVRVEAVDDAGNPVQIEIPQERYRELGLTKGMRIYVRPKDAFILDYVI